MLNAIFVLGYICSIAGLFRLSEAVNPTILREILDSGVKDKVYPGAVGYVGNLDGVLYEKPVGRHSYDLNDTLVKMNTIFDLASLTKVVSTTSAVALLYQNGYLALDTLIVDVLGDGFKNGGKDNITVLNCLLHNAGFAPDPVPWYWDPAFNCPNTAHEYPEEDFSCLNLLIYNSLLSETLATPPGEAFKYSDLSFITLQMVVGTLVLQHRLVPVAEMTACLGMQYSPSARIGTRTYTAQPQEIVCAFEAYVRTEVFHRSNPDSRSSNPDSRSSDAATATTSTTASTLSADVPPPPPLSSSSAWMPSTTYLPSEAVWGACMPTLNDTGNGSYTHKRLQGQVADGDCYAMGGIAGHAGVFSTAPDLAALAQYLLAQSVTSTDVSATLHSSASNSTSSNAGGGFLNATTVQLFTAVYNTSQSSRALGWDTNNPLVSTCKL